MNNTSHRNSNAANNTNSTSGARNVPAGQLQARLGHAVEHRDGLLRGSRPTRCRSWRRPPPGRPGSPPPATPSPTPSTADRRTPAARSRPDRRPRPPAPPPPTPPTAPPRHRDRPPPGRGTSGPAGEPGGIQVGRGRGVHHHPHEPQQLDTTPGDPVGDPLEDLIPRPRRQPGERAVSNSHNPSNGFHRTPSPLPDRRQTPGPRAASPTRSRTPPNPPASHHRPAGVGPSGVDSDASRHPPPVNVRVNVVVRHTTRAAPNASAPNITTLHTSTTAPLPVQPPRWR